MLAQLYLLLLLLMTWVNFCEGTTLEKDTKTKYLSTSLYSETVYDSRFDGTVHASRLRLSLDKKHFRPFIGFNFTRDLSNGGAPLFAINSWSPSIGLELRFFKYFGIITELKRLISNQTQTLWETQYGLYGYYFKKWNGVFLETYGESFAIDRVSNKPYLASWVKSGYRFTPHNNLFLDAFLEGFIRVTENPNYGPDENELRLGTRLTYFHRGFYISSIVNYAPVSNVKSNGVDALLVLGGDF